MPDSAPHAAVLTAGLTDDVARRALRISTLDGWFYSLMVGVSEGYLAPMAVELGHRDTALALLLTLPMLVGSLAQLLSGPLSALLGGRKRMVVVFASLQAVSLLGLGWIAAQGERALMPLLLADTLYFVCAMIVGPPWGAWMATLTEGRQRERYFAHRTALLQVALVLSFVGAGLYLQATADDLAHKLEAFALLHLVGFVMRAISAWLLSRQPDYEPSRRDVPASLRAVRVAAGSADFRVARYLAVLMFGAHVGVPFFTPYMLHDLGLDYARYAVLTAVPLVVKAMILPALHPLCVRFGMRRVLVWSGLGVVLMPALWAVTRSFDALVATQVLSGLAWGGIEYASYQLLLGGAREDCRVEFLSLATAMGSSAQLAGGLVGGELRAQLGVPYTLLFLLSALGRAAALPWLAERADPRAFRSLPRLFLRFIAVRPAIGAIGRPIVHDTPAQPSEERQRGRTP